MGFVYLINYNLGGALRGCQGILFVIIFVVVVSNRYAIMNLDKVRKNNARD